MTSFKFLIPNNKFKLYRILDRWVQADKDISRWRAIGVGLCPAVDEGGLMMIVLILNPYGIMT